MLREEVNPDDVAEIVAKWTGIPVTRLLESEREKLLRLREQLHDRVVGQDDTVNAVADAVLRAQGGAFRSCSPNRFLSSSSGPYGAEARLRNFAKALAETRNFRYGRQYGAPGHARRIHAGNYSVSRLIGAPPGYVGYL